MEMMDGRRLIKGVYVIVVEGIRKRGRLKRMWTEMVKDLVERRELEFLGS